jgi:hypothetical protein
MGEVREMQNAERVNPVVDLLDGKSEDFIKTQPRHCLRVGSSYFFTDNNGGIIEKRAVVPGDVIEPFTFLLDHKLPRTVKIDISTSRGKDY